MKFAPFVLCALALIAIAAGLGCWAYGQLPPHAVIATHFAADGRANGFMPKGQGLATGPLVGLGAVLILALIPRLTRQPDAIAKVRWLLGVATVGVAAMILFGQAMVINRALGGHADLVRWVVPASGVFLAVIGNFLGKVRRNEFVGVRTPWTLMDPRVWDKTQRFTGRLMVIGGLLAAIVGIAASDSTIRVAVLIVGAVGPALAGVIYSWAIFRQPSRTEI